MSWEAVRMEQSALPPVGTVTFLFTDIEGSTRLWEEHPEAMRLALARHDALLRAAIESHGGSVFKTMGDAFCAAFAAAPNALAAAVQAQRDLTSLHLGDLTTIRVRMALHRGAAERREGDYLGPPLNRVARLLQAGHGGQILLSQAAWDQVREALPPEIQVRDLGRHRLKDLQEPEHLFQLVIPGLPADSPPLRSLEAFAHNLPRQLTSFIGREREKAEIRELLSTTPLLTLTGAGGCGKTRLALQVAADLVEEFSDGVWLVELAALSDPDLVPQTVASSLGVREEPGRPILQALTDRLRSNSLLVLLDNCEHLIGACARLAETLLRSCPRLKILATSREALGIAGERPWRVPPLSVPDPRDLSRRAADLPLALSRYEASRLFIERARMLQPSFTVAPRNAAAVAQVCQRLDGIPLAIELAAARVKVLPVEKLAERLDEMFRLLTGGTRTALPRQQTLRALIDWSYDLLSEPEQALLRRLSGFAGGWTLEAAEAVCSAEGARGQGSGAREGVCLGPSDRGQATPPLTPGQDHRCAAVPPLAPDEVLDLLTSLVEKSLVLYEEREEEGRYRLLETVRQYARDRLLEAEEAEAMRERHCEMMAQARGDHESAWRLWGEGLAINRELGSRPFVARSLRGLGTVAHLWGNLEAARELLEESLAISRELGDKSGLAQSLFELGFLTQRQGEHRAAQALLEENLPINRELGNKVSIAWSLGFLGWGTSGQKEYEAAQALFEERVAINRGLWNKRHLAWALTGLGWVTRMRGDNTAAQAALEESLAISRAQGYKPYSVENLEGLAAVAVMQAQPERAARLFGAAEGLREAMGAPLPPADRAEHDRSVAAVRTALSEEAFAAAWAAGRAMTLEQAVTYALGQPEAEPPT